MKCCLLALSIGLLMVPGAMAQFGSVPPAAEPEPLAEAPQPEAPQENQQSDGTAAEPARNLMFEVIDADGDGVISKSELRKAIRALKTLDADEDGNITLAEVSAGGPPIAAVPDVNQLVDRIMVNDLNQDGMLSAAELPAHMRQALRNADLDRNLVIDKRELALAIQRMPQLFQPGAQALPGGANGVAAPGVRVPGAGAQSATGRYMRFDANNDGRLSADEIPEASREEAMRADEDGDGALDPGEIEAAMRKAGDRARAAGVETGNGSRNRRARDN